MHVVFFLLVVRNFTAAAMSRFQWKHLKIVLSACDDIESRETKGNTIRGSTWQWREGPYRKSKLKAKHATSGFLVNNKTFVAAAERRCSGYFMSHVSDANLKHTLSEIQQSSSCSDNAGMLLWLTKCQLSFICPLNSIKNIETHCRW